LAGVHYPLIEHSAETLYAASGRAIADVTLEAAAAGTLSPDDLQINAATLLAQADVARKAGFPQLAANLARAAELTAAPNDELLRMYTMLRPGRSTYAELLALAAQLEAAYAAPRTAAWVREAAGVYQQRGLLRRDP
jgi:propanediol dehydratase small subunit